MYHLNLVQVTSDGLLLSAHVNFYQNQYKDFEWWREYATPNNKSKSRLSTWDEIHSTTRRASPTGVRGQSSSGRWCIPFFLMYKANPKIKDDLYMCLLGYVVVNINGDHNCTLPLKVYFFLSLSWIYRKDLEIVSGNLLVPEMISVHIIEADTIQEIPFVGCIH